MIEIRGDKKVLITPISAEDLADIKIGDIVWLDGDLMTCRDVAHRRLVEYDMWREAFAELGIDPAFYAYRRREKDEIMPWDVIDCGVTKEFLWREKEKAEKAQTTKDCRKGCNGCGLQRFKGVCKYCG